MSKLWQKTTNVNELVENFTVGRGMYNGGVTDWSNALIDEVRISDTVLTPNQFLFVTVPEPSSAFLCALGMLGLLGRIRK